MKKILLFILSLTLASCLFGCDNEEPPAGGGESEITGSIAYFYGDEETAIEAFYSEDTEAKKIELSKEVTYTIGLRPSFRGSKAAVYNGDCATFSFADGCCEIIYLGEEDNHPIYELKIKTDSDFDFTVTVGDYTQTIRIVVEETPVSDEDHEDEKLLEFYFDVIETLEITDIERVESQKYAGSSSPQYREPVEHRSSTLDADIEAVYTWLKDLENNVTPIANQELPGGSSVCLTVHTSLGTLVLWENADNNLLMCGNYFSQKGEMPEIQGESVTYSFESYTSDADFLFGSTPLGMVTFDFNVIKCKISKQAFYEAEYKLDTDIGTLTVFDSKHFKRNGVTYEIVSEHTLPNVSITVNDAYVDVYSAIWRTDGIDCPQYFKVDIPYTTYYTVSASSPVRIYNQLLENGSSYESGESFSLPKGIWYFEVSAADFGFNDLYFLIEPKGAVASPGMETVVSYHTNNFYSFEAPGETSYTVSTRGDLNNDIEAVITVKKLSNGIWTDVCRSEKAKFPSLTFSLLKGERVFIFVELIGAYDQAFIMGLDYTDEALRDASSSVELSLQTVNYLNMQSKVDKTVTFTPDRTAKYQLRAAIRRNEILSVKIYKNGIFVGSDAFVTDKYGIWYIANELELDKGVRYDFVLSYEHPTYESSEIEFVIDRAYGNLSAGLATAGTTAYEWQSTVSKANTYRYAMFGDGEWLFNAECNGTWFENPQYDTFVIKGEASEGIQYMLIERYGYYFEELSSSQFCPLIVEVAE